MGVGGQRHAPAGLRPGKTQYPLYMGLGCPRASLDGYGKFHAHRDSIPGPFSPLASRYTDYPLFYAFVFDCTCVCVCVCLQLECIYL
jgi:hypothetical protein